MVRRTLPSDSDSHPGFGRHRGARARERAFDPRPRARSGRSGRHCALPPPLVDSGDLTMAARKKTAPKAIKKLSHVGKNRTAKMVDVTAKLESAREARASGKITISRAATALVKKHSLEKGPVTAVARF